jgi:succinate dehydrogenase / fumarate reductase iron-sulfur subunit
MVVSDLIWKINLIIARQITGGPKYFQTYELEVDPNEYVLDAIERVWAFQDKTLTFRHACHHSTCGACGMLLNGIEKLTCIVPICTVTQNGGTIKVEPLRNFPVVSDLVVDTSTFFSRLELTHFIQVSPINEADLPYEKEYLDSEKLQPQRLVDCIECGLCISACPIALTDSEYLGPAALAAAQHTYRQNGESSLLELVDNKNGAWRCHSAYECSDVCPSNVNPGWRIIDLRKAVIREKFIRLFRKGSGK